MALIILKHTDINGGNPVSIPASTLTIGYSKINSNSPNANLNSDEPVVRVQSQSIANPLYSISRIQLDLGTYGGYNALSQELLKQFLTLDNDDSDPIILNVKYDTDTNWESLQKYTGARVSDIPVTVNGSVNITLDTSSSENAYRPTTSISLLETRKV